ncbi:MAG: DUF5011 domain-containing protein, partial [Turicibacter sp.]|nr:DUF5011 domain-containing protein [Turicibacter sp.]
EKANIVITQEDTIETVTEKFTELKDVVITNNDMISITHTNPNLVRIQGDVVNNSDDYTDGFISTEAMEAVRFKITNHGLTEVKAVDFNIVIENPDAPLEITRGSDYNLIQGVTVDHPNEVILSESISIKDFDINHIGEQTITYEVTDSWGKIVRATRKVIVEVANELENNKIHLLSEMIGAKKLTIGFDAVEMKLTAIPQENNVLTKLFKDLPSEEVVFSISLYNNAHELKQTYEFIGNDLNEDSQIITQINEQIFNYGDYFDITAYNYEKGLEFVGTVELDEDNKGDSDYDAMSKEEFITNARFQITEDGLKALYNEAPKIEGVTVKEVYIGEESQFLQGIKVTDDHDELAVDEIDTVTNADFYEPGQYDVTYSITDTWGRTSSITSQIWVLSTLQKNEVII